MTSHKCSSNPYRLDYSEANNGRIDCTVCTWGWRLTNAGWKRIDRAEAMV